MKTSNKLILGLIAFLCVSAVSLMIAAKSNTTFDGVANTIVGSGNMTTASHQIKDFKGVHTEGRMNVEVLDGAYAVEVATHDNLQGQLQLGLNDEGMLTIKFKPGQRVAEGTPVNIKIHMPDSLLQELSSRDRSHIVMPDTFKAGSNVTMTTKGNASITATVVAESITAYCKGASQMKLSGKTKSLEVRNSGASEFYAENLEAQEVALKGYGNTVNHVFAVDRLNIEVSGSNKVAYRGTPSMRQESNGSNRIQTLE